MLGLSPDENHDGLNASARNRLKSADRRWAVATWVGYVPVLLFAVGVALAAIALRDFQEE